MWKKILIVVLALALASPLAACGRKGALKNPPDTTYPKKYPTK